MFNNSKFVSDSHIYDLKASYGPQSNEDTFKIQTFTTNNKNTSDFSYLGLHNLDESILKDDDEDDYGFLPYKRPWLMQHYDDQVASRWVSTDIPLKEDRPDYDEADEN